LILGGGGDIFLLKIVQIRERKKMFAISLNPAAYGFESLGKDHEELRFTCAEKAADRTGPLGGVN
jgi:hypothetical protein